MTIIIDCDKKRKIYKCDISKLAITMNSTQLTALSLTFLLFCISVVEYCLARAYWCLDVRNSSILLTSAWGLYLVQWM